MSYSLYHYQTINFSSVAPETQNSTDYKNAIEMNGKEIII